MKETIFDSLPVIGKSLAEIKPSDKYREKCPAGSALAMSIAQNAVQLKKQNKLLTVICADPSDVIRLQDEVTWFDPSLKLTVFPDWETLPYDVLSPHADLVGERLQTLYFAFKSSKTSGPRRRLNRFCQHCDPASCTEKLYRLNNLLLPQGRPHRSNGLTC